MATSSSDWNGRAPVQQAAASARSLVQQAGFIEYVPTRESDVDRAAACAGPGFAIVADAHGITGVVRFDVEAGCPIDAIPAAGFVS